MWALGSDRIQRRVIKDSIRTVPFLLLYNRGMKVCSKRSVLAGVKNSLSSLRRMSSLQRFPFETQNGEHYWAAKDNRSYQSARAGFKGATFAHQADLPSLVVPELNQTMAKYLESIKPFCKDASEYYKQELLVRDFLGNMGPVLHQRLVKFSEGKRNWMSEFWDNQSYLEYNDPVVPYVSYFYTHQRLPKSHKRIDADPLLKATAIIVTASRFIEALKDQSLPQELIKGTPFCMNSFELMFNSCRLPGNAEDNRDTSIFYSIYENNFIIVSFKGNYYKVLTHNESDGTPLNPREIWEQLYFIVSGLNSQLQSDTNAGIGLLTSLPRDQWRKVHHELAKNPLSKDSLSTIHKASYLLALDLDDQPISLEEKSRNAWHGDGINRFFDKFVQFFVCGNGSSGFLGEHSKMDGTPTCFLNHYICKEISNLAPTEFIDNVFNRQKSSVLPAKDVTHLPFLITPFIKGWIEKANELFAETMDEHDLRVWHYNRYGKNFIKKQGMSPDAFIQQIIQLAVYRYLGKQLPTYEAASTRKFFKGRTETGRSVSIPSAKFVSTWEDPSATISEKIDVLKKSAKYHSDYLKAAAAGNGIDRHFFGMKNMLQNSDETPKLFQDPLFNYSSTWLISTSQLSSEFFSGYGWSQVNDNGFGLAYMLNNEWLHINIVNKPMKSGLSVNSMHYYLCEAADEIADTLISSAEPLKSKL